MEIRQLKAFVTVAEELNFRKAAERLGMTQPPLTRLITELESQLNTKLFTRTTRSVELTGAGIFLLEKSRNIIKEMEKIEMEIRTLQKLKTGKLQLSLSFTALHSIVPKLIGSFKKQYPKIAIEINDVPVTSLEKSLKSGRIDIAFGMNDLNDSEFSSFNVHTQEAGLLIHKDNPLADKKSIKLEDLKGQTLIFHSKHEKLDFQLDFADFLARKKIHVNIYYKKPKESCPHLVMLGKGLLLTSHLMAHENSECVFIPFSEFKPKLKIRGTWSDKNESFALKAFKGFLLEHLHAPVSGADKHLG